MSRNYKQQIPVFFGQGFQVVFLEALFQITVVYWGYIGIMEKKMETTGIIGVI